MDNDGLFVLVQFFNGAFCTHHDRTAAGQISGLCTGIAQNQASGRKIRSGNNVNQVFDRNKRIVDISAAGVNHFAQIMRRNIGSHTDGNTVCAVNQKVRITGRQNSRFLQAFVIVGHKVDGVFVDVVNQRVGNFCQTGFGITHGSGAVAVH